MSLAAARGVFYFFIAIDKTVRNLPSIRLLRLIFACEKTQKLYLLAGLGLHIKA